ncbi:MAG: hypothetical protein QOG46_2115 [Pseudonocardiales bacterium]|jgi:hypothetical protein|nr:hypothetical protein [Pseudonocardiales bacterium]
MPSGALSATGRENPASSPSRSSSGRSRMGRRLRGHGRRCVGAGVVPADIGTHLPFFRAQRWIGVYVGDGLGSVAWCGGKFGLAEGCW